MKLFLIVAVLLLGILLVFVVKAVQSQQAPDLGLVKEKLRPCPDKPNCVSSQANVDDTQHYIAPLALQAHTWQALLNTINSMGGKLEYHDDHYLHATFRSSVFHYVDDLEAYIDSQQVQIHWRSASRVGYSDFGVNRKRCLRIAQALHQ